MRCYHCGWEVPDGYESCPNCGAGAGAGDTVLLDQTVNPYAADHPANRTEELTTLLTNDPYAQSNVQYSARPAIRFDTNRKLWKMILFGLLTFGIYDIVIYCKIVTELNVAACRYDGKRTMPFMAMTTLAPVTLGILPLVWFHKMSNRMGDELQRRGYSYKFSATTYWLWGVLGSLIFVGPLVYVHKMLKAMNAINEDFNNNG